MSLIKYGFLLSFMAISSLALVQTNDKDQLIRKKEKIEQEIQFTNRLLNDTRDKRTNTLQELKLLNAKIRKRNALIERLSSEIDQLEKEIQAKTKKLQSLKGELEKTRKEYAELIYYAFKNRNTNIDFMYLLAADDINQFYIRYKYLQQYKDYRLKSIQLIIQLKKLIEVEIIELSLKKNEKVNMFNKFLAEKAMLVQDEEEIDGLVLKLKQQETTLKKDLDEKKKLKAKIEKEIENIIKKEAKKKSYTNLTPEEKLISDDFVKNKGKLPWPTEQGIVTDKFGEHDHPVIKDLKIRNHGIDITTIPMAKARAVFQGEVTKVFSIKGANSGVIIRHGNFYTVYLYLKDVYVKAGDQIGLKGAIGEVYTDTKKNECILNFQIWKELEKQNPEEWLSN